MVRISADVFFGLFEHDFMKSISSFYKNFESFEFWRAFVAPNLLAFVHSIIGILYLGS